MVESLICSQCGFQINNNRHVSLLGFVTARCDNCYHVNSYQLDPTYKRAYSSLVILTLLHVVVIFVFHILEYVIITDLIGLISLGILIYDVRKELKLPR